MRAKVIDDNVVACPYLDEQIRADNPNVSFPAILAGMNLEEFGVYDVQEDDLPYVDHTQTAVYDEPVFIDGKVIQTVTISDATEAEIAQRKEGRLAEIRIQRNIKLAASDWTQLADAPVDEEAWAEYRQALRDITKQADPFAIIWPVEPS